MPGFKDDARHDGHLAGKIIGSLMAGVALVGCATTPEAKPVETTSQLPPTPDKPSTPAGEQIGQHTEIPRDKLHMMEQKTSIEQMEAMSAEEFAKLDIADRSAYGYTLVQRILQDASNKDYNVAPLNKDNVSFAYDAPSGIGSGVLILGAIEQQLDHVAGGDVTELQAKKLALALEYAPTKNGAITPAMESSMAKYSEASQEPAVQVVGATCKKETGWVEGTDANGRDQWFKAMEIVVQDEGIDQTVQEVRVTVKLSDGTEVVWFTRGAASDEHAGDLVTSFAEKTIG